MKTNELKKGTRVLLRNGWEATILDNRKGLTRYCEVYGDFTESGFIYSYDFAKYRDKKGNWKNVEYTLEQLKSRQMNDFMFSFITN